MELISNELYLGFFFFLLGILILSQCNSLDRKNYYKLRNLRRLELYGRRDLDSKATLPLDVLCSSMTILGGGFSLYGFIRIFSTLLI